MTARVTEERRREGMEGRGRDGREEGKRERVTGEAERDPRHPLTGIKAAVDLSRLRHPLHPSFILF